MIGVRLKVLCKFMVGIVLAFCSPITYTQAATHSAYSAATTVVFVNGTYAMPMPYIIEQSSTNPQSQTQWVPIWYISRALRIALGVSSEWDGDRWSFGALMEAKELNLKRRNYGHNLSVFMDGKSVYVCPKEVAKDPWGHHMTTFITINNMVHILSLWMFISYTMGRRLRSRKRCLLMWKILYRRVIMVLSSSQIRNSHTKMYLFRKSLSILICSELLYAMLRQGFMRVINE